MLEKLRTKKIITTPNFPTHTQAVEKIIKIVTDASEIVAGEEARKGYIRARIEGRKNKPVRSNRFMRMIVSMKQFKYNEALLYNTCMNHR